MSCPLRFLASGIVSVGAKSFAALTPSNVRLQQPTALQPKSWLFEVRAWLFVVRVHSSGGAVAGAVIALQLNSIYYSFSTGVVRDTSTHMVQLGGRVGVSVVDGCVIWCAGDDPTLGGGGQRQRATGLGRAGFSVVCSCSG